MKRVRLNSIGEAVGTSLSVTLTRDAISFCEDSPHTFYRLPFHGGWPLWALTQGNFGSVSHTGSQVYAFDFTAPAGTQIRAARGGIVEAVQESLSANTYDPNLMQCTNMSANKVAIRHQDGSLGNYGHILHNGVLVSVGQKVRRGDVIALVGETGCASGPHVHFWAGNVTGQDSIPARFEAWRVCYIELGIPNPCFPWQECYVPETGDILFSTQ